jgi:hypothetical protein
MKNGVVWDVLGCLICIPCQRASDASYGYVPSSPILVTLIMEALNSFETSVLTRATWRNIPEDAVLLSHCFFSQYWDPLNRIIWGISFSPYFIMNLISLLCCFPRQEFKHLQLTQLLELRRIYSVKLIYVP